MSKYIILLCVFGSMLGCTINTAPDSDKPTHYSLDSVNPR